MRCLFNIRSKKSNSAPELRKQTPEDASQKRVTKSANSAASSSGSMPEIYRKKDQKLKLFSFSELREATNDFNRVMKIGEGGFGIVYKGTIKGLNGKGKPTLVAIKRLKSHSLQGHKEWLAEVRFLGIVDHPNLVKLLGYCCVDSQQGIQRLLVYENMPNRSLEHHLFLTNGSSCLPWLRRLQIMLGAARGLAYLHDGMDVKVIFRDFKSSNVLLDENMNAKLSDFGLAREGPIEGDSHVSTEPVGTQGYAAPEYVETGHLHIKSDIYSYGVVLYEILTGRQAIKRSRPASEQKLVEWVKQFPPDSDMFRAIMDFGLRNQYPLNTARKIAKLADRCLDKNPRDRPDMNEIIEVLEEAIVESEGSCSGASNRNIGS